MTHRPAPSPPAYEPLNTSDAISAVLVGFFVSAPFWVIFFIGLNVVLK